MLKFVVECGTVKLTAPTVETSCVWLKRKNATAAQNSKNLTMSSLITSEIHFYHDVVDSFTSGATCPSSSSCRVS